MKHRWNYWKSYSMINIPWYKKAIFSNAEKIVFWSLYGFIFVFTFLILNYFFDLKFMWEDISPFEVPSIPVRAFLSALAFVWPWALFYYLKIYQDLYRALPYKTFLQVKAVIWFCFSAMIYIFIATFIEFLNFLANAFFNAYHFFIFISPILAISVWVLLIWIFWYTKWKKWEVRVIFKI